MTDETILEAWSVAICARVAEGVSLRKIGEEMGCSAGTVLARATYNPAGVERYGRARDAAADLFESRILDEVEQPSPDRTRVDALKWIAGRRRPLVYGERATMRHEGAVAVATTDLTDEQRAILRAAMLDKI